MYQKHEKSTLIAVSIKITKGQNKFLDELVEKGIFQSKSEVIRFLLEILRILYKQVGNIDFLTNFIDALKSSIINNINSNAHKNERTFKLYKAIVCRNCNYTICYLPPTIDFENVKFIASKILCPKCQSREFDLSINSI